VAQNLFIDTEHSFKTYEVLKSHVNKIEKDDIMPENTPHSIAAGVVYFISQICKLNVSKRDIKNVSETSEVTINKCFKKLEKITKDENIIPAAIIKKYNAVL
jgi:transcription initiation factor TFIIIB Brf1 subunit/transcription initiation factor TFIIB